MTASRRLAVFLSLAIIGGATPLHSQDAKRGPAWKVHVIDNSAAGADGARLMDVNGDKLPDIATGFEEGNRVGVMLHPGGGKVRDKWPSVTVGKVKAPEDAVFVDLDGGIKFDLIQLVHLDGDGDLDVINTEERAKGGGLGVVWYENPTK